MERMLSRFDLPRVDLLFWRKFLFRWGRESPSAMSDPLKVDSPFVYIQPYWVCDIVEGCIHFPRLPLEAIVAFVDLLNSRAGLFEVESGIIPSGVSVNLIPVYGNDPGGGICLYSPKLNISWPCRIPCDSTV